MKTWADMLITLLLMAATGISVWLAVAPAAHDTVTAFSQTDSRPEGPNQRVVLSAKDLNRPNCRFQIVRYLKAPDGNSKTHAASQPGNTVPPAESVTILLDKQNYNGFYQIRLTDRAGRVLALSPTFRLASARDVPTAITPTQDADSPSFGEPSALAVNQTFDN